MASTFIPIWVHEIHHHPLGENGDTEVTAKPLAPRAVLSGALRALEEHFAGVDLDQGDADVSHRYTAAVVEFDSAGKEVASHHYDLDTLVVLRERR